MTPQNTKRLAKDNFTIRVLGSPLTNVKPAINLNITLRNLHTLGRVPACSCYCSGSLLLLLRTFLTSRSKQHLKASLAHLQIGSFIKNQVSINFQTKIPSTLCVRLNAALRNRSKPTRNAQSIASRREDERLLRENMAYCDYHTNPGKCVSTTTPTCTGASGGNNCM